MDPPQGMLYVEDWLTGFPTFRTLWLAAAEVVCDTSLNVTKHQTSSKPVGKLSYGASVRVTVLTTRNL